MKANAINAIVDCGSSYYLIVYRYEGTTYKVNIEGQRVDSKVPSTAYLPTLYTDVKKPRYDAFYFGDSPQTNQELAFIPNWKNYFFDADEVVSYPNVPSVPSKNHRSVRVLASALFEAFMANTIAMLETQTNTQFISLKFLIPSVASERHRSFLKLCADAVKKQFTCEIELIYEAEAALSVCGNVPVGDFGGFTFDKASLQHHEACNLAASNIDQVFEQLIRAECIDLRFRNRNLLYERIMHLKEGYKDEDVILLLDDVFYPFELLQHKLTYEMYDKKNNKITFEKAQIMQYLEEHQFEHRLWLGYFAEMKGMIQASQFYAEFRHVCMDIIMRFRGGKNRFVDHTAPEAQQFFAKYGVCGDFEQMFDQQQCLNELRQLLNQYYDYEHIPNDGRPVTLALLHLIHSHAQLAKDVTLDDMASFMAANKLEYWLMRLQHNFELHINCDAGQVQGFLFKEYVLTPEHISVVIRGDMYKAVADAVCKEIVQNFAEFLEQVKATDFYITGNFSESPLLHEQMVKNARLREILARESHKSEDNELIAFMLQKRRRAPEQILEALLSGPEVKNIEETIQTSYSHYVLDVQGNLKYNRTTAGTTHKGRICIDEGTSGSLLSYIEANTQLSDAGLICGLPDLSQRSRIVDDALFKAGAKIPSFCVVNVPLAVRFACKKYGIAEETLKNAADVEHCLNRYFNEQLLSLIELQQIFLYDEEYKSVQNVLQEPGKADPAVQAQEAPAGKINARERAIQMKEQEQIRSVAHKEGRFNEPLIVEYWKRYLYAKEYIKFPFEPRFQERYTYNSMSINIDFPIAYFYIAQMVYFYKLYENQQNDMTTFYNQIGLTLTVPCAAKQQHLTFLRECARYANLPDDLVFVYEPNSAFSDMFYREIYRNSTIFEKQHYILVLDVGAGTTDLSLLNISVEELNPDLSTFNVTNFYEINYAGNNVIDAVIRDFGITDGTLKNLSSITKSSLREQIKNLVEVITNQEPGAVSTEAEMNIIIMSRAEMTHLEQTAYNEMKEALSSHTSGNQKAMQGANVLETFYVKAEEFIKSINEVQNKIFDKTIEFCRLNKSMLALYEVAIVPVGGMGSSKYFSKSLKLHIDEIRSNYLYISFLDVQTFEDSIARGGIYLKAEKDYVDYAAPLIERGTETEDKIISENKILANCEISILSFENVDMCPQYQQFIFVQNGKRWFKSEDGKSDTLLAPSTHLGVEIIVFVSYKRLVTSQTREYYAYLIRVPLQYLNQLHGQEEICPAGVPQYLYEIDCALVETPPFTSQPAPLATINVRVSVSGTNGAPSISNSFNLFRYVPTSNYSTLNANQENEIMLLDTIPYPKIRPFLRHLQDTDHGKANVIVFKYTQIVKLPQTQWRQNVE